MKKLFSILFAAMLLLSGMHLSLATHVCGGKISQVKLSFTHEKTTCGMCGEEETIPLNSISTERCCHDKISYFVIDNNYKASAFQINKLVNQSLQVFDIPKTIGIQSTHTNSTLNTNVQPPGNCFVSAVSLPDICVFLI